MLLNQEDLSIFDIIISIPLTKYFGGVGAALGTSFGQIVGNVLIINIYYHKKDLIKQVNKVDNILKDIT